jgi:CheY-like chemotaxis protein
VLTADDSASMRRSVRFLLERRHSELMVSEAVDGVDAIEKAKETKTDLILLDLAMPRLNGVEAASVLKNRKRQSFCSLCIPTCMPIL